MNMQKIDKILIAIAIVTLLALLTGQYGFHHTGKTDMKHVMVGNHNYKKEHYDKAELDYRRGIDADGNSFQSQYNLGNSLFRQEKYPEAAEAFAKSLSKLSKDSPKDQTRYADACHNLGNAYYAQQQFDKAVEAYAQSLRYRPSDNDTRYNLAKALEMLKQQQQNQDQQQQNQQKQDQQQEQQNQDQQQEQQNQDQQQEQQDESKMDKETAEQILQALEQDEQDTQEKMQRVQGSKKRVEKNW